MNVFDNGQPDERQTEETKIAPQHSLFRKRYRQMTADEVALHDAIKDKADELAALLDRVNDIVVARPKPHVWGAPSLSESVGSAAGPNVTLAIRHLEDAVYRAVKALTA